MISNGGALSKECEFCNIVNMVPNKSPYFIVIRGIPGCGKTSLAVALSNKIVATVINPDTISINDLKLSIDERVKNLKYRQCLETAKDALRSGQNVIWEQPWRKVQNIKLTYESIMQSFATDALYPVFTVVELPCDKDVAWERCKRKYNSREQFNEFIMKYQTYNLQYPHLLLEDATITKNTEIVLKYLESL